MIEFDGHISGLAKSYFCKKEKMFGMKVTLISLVVAYPIILIMANYLRGTFNNPALVLTCIYLLLFSFIPLLSLVNPLEKKGFPKKISTDGEYIAVIIECGQKTCKLISDVKCVNDFGEFYALDFPLSAGINNAFICQKNLLTKGTIEEFEALFEGKIVRKN